MELRPATEKDYDVLFELFSEIQTLHYDTRPDIFKPLYMFSFMFFIAFVVAPIILLERGWVGVRSNNYREQLATAMLLVSIGLVGFYIGYLLIQSRWRSPLVPSGVRRQVETEGYCPERHRQRPGRLGQFGSGVRLHSR